MVIYFLIGSVLVNQTVKVNAARDETLISIVVEKLKKREEIVVFNCSQTKFVAIILVLSVFFMQFFA